MDKMKKFSVFGKEYDLSASCNTQETCVTKENLLIQATILFARKGFHGVSIKDLATEIGIQPSTIYHHFESKQALWDAVISRAEYLWRLYFDSLEEQLDKATSFVEQVAISLAEPKIMANSFTCFAFSLIVTEQFTMDNAFELSNGLFWDYSVKVLARYFGVYIDESSAFSAALAVMNIALQAVNIATNELIGHKNFISVKEFIEIQENAIIRAFEPRNNQC